MMLTSSSLNRFFIDQLNHWEQARANYQALEKVQTKTFTLAGDTVRLQFNPARIASSTAKVDKQSIEQRKCFLCPENLPSVQQDIPFNKEYHILVNPFPIFRQHFTIPTYAHTDQTIYTRIEVLFELAEQFTEHTMIYNGPHSGASAPDHAHFQAGERGFLPIEEEVRSYHHTPIANTEKIAIYPIESFGRKGVYLRSGNRDEASDTFRKIYNLLELKEGNLEPMMNIITWYQEMQWHCCIFPREKHRPACYYAEGNDRLLISPGAVDIAGVLITPFEHDFHRITAETIRKVFEEVCLSGKAFRQLTSQLKDIAHLSS